MWRDGLFDGLLEYGCDALRFNVGDGVRECRRCVGDGDCECRRRAGDGDRERTLSIICVNIWYNDEIYSDYSEIPCDGEYKMALSRDGE